MGKSLIIQLIYIQLIIQMINLLPQLTMASDRSQQSILITSGLKWGQLTVQCVAFGASKLKVYAVIEARKSFGWDFDITYHLGSLYYASYTCDFEWINVKPHKKLRINIWNTLNRETTCVGRKTQWAVLENGFYFRCGGGNWQKRYTWDGPLHLGPGIDNPPN